MASAPAGRETLVRRLSSHSTLAEIPTAEIPAWATPPMGPLPPSTARPTRRSIAAAALISVSTALDLTCNQMLTDGCLRLVNITFNPAACPPSPDAFSTPQVALMPSPNLPWPAPTAPLPHPPRPCPQIALTLVVLAYTSHHRSFSSAPSARSSSFSAAKTGRMLPRRVLTSAKLDQLALLVAGGAGSGQAHSWPDDAYRGLGGLSADVAERLDAAAAAEQALADELAAAADGQAAAVADKQQAAATHNRQDAAAEDKQQRAAAADLLLLVTDAAMKQAVVDKQAAEEMRAAAEKQAEASKKSAADRQAVADRQAAASKQAAIEEQAAADRKAAEEMQVAAANAAAATDKQEADKQATAANVAAAADSQAAAANALVADQQAEADKQAAASDNQTAEAMHLQEVSSPRTTDPSSSRCIPSYN